MGLLCRFVLMGALSAGSAALAAPASEAKGAAKTTAPTSKPTTGIGVLKTDKQRLGYSLGMSLGSQMKRSPMQIDAKSFAAAMKDVLSGGKTRMSEQEARQVMMTVQKSMMARRRARQPGQQAPPDAPPMPDKEKLGYGLGMRFAGGLKAEAPTVDVDALAKGIEDGASGAKPLLTAEEAKGIMEAWQKSMKERRAARAQENKKKSDAFLAENKKKEGVVTLPSGLQYQILKEGTGSKPKETDRVTVHYRGTLIDGTEFDSSYAREKPATFPVRGVIKGWTEALQLMKTGAKWKLFVPPDLAYGQRGQGRKIKPNSALIFEVELLSAEAAKPMPKPKTVPELKARPVPKKTK